MIGSAGFGWSGESCFLVGDTGATVCIGVAKPEEKINVGWVCWVKTDSRLHTVLWLAVHDYVVHQILVFLEGNEWRELVILIFECEFEVLWISMKPFVLKVELCDANGRSFAEWMGMNELRRVLCSTERSCKWHNDEHFREIKCKLEVLRRWLWINFEEKLLNYCRIEIWKERNLKRFYLLRELLIFREKELLRFRIQLK